MTGNTLVPGKASETELCRMMDEYSSMLVGICAILLDAGIWRRTLYRRHSSGCIKRWIAFAERAPRAKRHG